MPDDHSPTLGELGLRIAALEDELKDLRAQLTAAQNRADLTMRGQRCCPACGGQKIHYSESVLDRSDSGRMKMALLQPSVWRVKGAGQFETYICAGCGLVEWYVQNPESLAEHLDLLEHPSPQNDGGPYR